MALLTPDGPKPDAESWWGKVYTEDGAMNATEERGTNWRELEGDAENRGQ